MWLSSKTSLFVCCSKIPKTGWLIYDRHLRLVVPEAGRLRPECRRGGVGGFCGLQACP